MKVRPTLRCRSLSSICKSLRRLSSSALRGSSRSTGLARTRARVPELRAAAVRPKVGPACARPSRELHDFEGLPHALLDDLARSATNPKRERHILEHRKVGKQRIALKHHAKIPPFRREVIDAGVQEDAAGGRQDEAGNRHQERGLAGAGWTRSVTNCPRLICRETSSSAATGPNAWSRFESQECAPSDPSVAYPVLGAR